MVFTSEVHCERRPHCEPAQFTGQLASVLAGRRLPEDICKALAVDNDRKLIRPDWLRRSIHRASSIILNWLGQFNRVDLLGPAASKCHQPKRWPQIFLAAYLVFALAAAINIHFQYIYDANSVKLQKLHSLLNNAAERRRLLNRLDCDQLSQEFERRRDGARRVLKLMGASTIDWLFLTESLMLLLLQTLNWFIWIPYTTRGRRRRRSPWTLLTAKSLVSESNENSLRLAMTLNELDCFARQSDSLHGVKLDRMRRDLSTNSGAGLVRANKWNKLELRSIELALDFHAARWERERELTVKRLQQLALEGRFNPLNRTPSCRDKLKLAYLCFGVAHHLASHLILFWSLNAVIVHYKTEGRFMRLDTCQDVWSLFYLVALTEISFTSALFLNALFFCIVLDQLVANQRLRTLIMAVVRANDQRQRQLLLLLRANSTTRSSVSKRAHLVECFERDLATVVVQYKLAMATFKLDKRPVRQMATCLVCFGVSVPVVFVVHSSYFSAEIRKILLAVGAATTTFFCLGFLAPLGLLYKRQLRTLDAVWTLVGQLSQLESMHQLNGQLELSSSVSLFTLRRLLGDSRQTIEHASIKVLAMPVTYTNLVRLYTYVIVFMMASGFMTLRLFGDGLASIMSDPFGLYKFLKFD